MKNREELFRISPDTRELKPGRGRERAEALDCVLVGKFRDDLFVPIEMKFASPETHGLGLLADQMHFDAVRFLIVDGPVSPLREIEVRAQFAIRARKHVEIESGGHARAVVVGSFQDLV